ncbi:MAG: patatin-like phospholipase family protein [Calditrichaeota bacterium]|nr:patatin-like phospholipase family protein [Calditrichota bacterium]
MPIRLKDVVEPFEDEFQQLSIDLKSVSHLMAEYNGEEHAFVDVVLEGGGVKGIAITGALYALERMGIRFRKIAGTSAGAINAAFVAAASKHISEKRIDRIANVILNMNLIRFVDGGRGAEAFVNAIMNKDAGMVARLNKMFSITRNLEQIIKKWGINPGNTLKNWLLKNLANLNHGRPLTVGDLKKRLENGPDDIIGDFQIVVTDITNRRKAIFPKDLRLYFKNPDEILISDLIRASTSIPIFFQPFFLKDFFSHSGYAENSQLVINDHTTFVDGAVVSNFPLGIFDKKVDQVPVCPTFGVLFNTEFDYKSSEIKSILDYGLAIMETLNDYGDRSYIFQNNAQARIITISNKVNNKAIESIYFNLDADDIKALFANGIRAAIDFIKRWNFQNYLTNIREVERQQSIK